MVFNVVIADDDSGMRLMLRKCIEKVEGFNVEGEAQNSEEAVKLTETLKPDIVFLDIEMPMLNGIECAKCILDIKPETYIIFVTAHSEYMPDAVDIYAFDYMIKPFKIERIHQTLERIRDFDARIKKSAGNKPQPIHDCIDRLLIKNKDGINIVTADDILLVQREGRNTVIYTSDVHYITSESLSELEERLDKNKFFRSHKSYIVNLSKIQKICPYGRWTYIIKLQGIDNDALLTYERYEELENIFK